jgi:hypothetical protein
MTENDDVKKSIFNSMSRNTQVIFVGVLAGVLIIGIYMTAVGVMQYVEKPMIISSGVVGADFPLVYQHNHYSSKDEIEIYNRNGWNIDSVWIGTDLEYQAFKGNLYMAGGQKNLFKGPFNNPKDLSYKLPLTSDLSQKIIVNVGSTTKTYLIISNGTKFDAKISITEVS